MNALWDYFWPLFALGVVSGAILGSVWLRRKRPVFLVLGAIVALGGAWAWHGPIGAADRLVDSVESQARTSLDDYEMTQVHAHLQRGPLTRRLLLSGPADDFQRSELVKIMDQIPGVSEAEWSEARGIPLLVQAAMVAVLGFLLGLLVAYVVELRRRYNSQWTW